MTESPSKSAPDAQPDAAVRYETVGSVAVLTIDNPPVNALGQAVRQGLLDGLRQAEADEEVVAILLVGAGRTFIAGADIKEFGKPPQPPSLPEVLGAFDATAKPTVAALHGTALGGGLETALVCHYRVALPGTQVGLPEVNLGILPGAGGTQRLPRLVGAERALELITGGAFLRTEEALGLGVLDEVSAGAESGDGPREAGLAYARRVIEEGRGPRRVRDIDPGTADAAVFDRVWADLEARVPNLFAPFRIVEAVRAAFELPFDEGLKRERALFQQCMESPQRAGLIHAFFAERQATKLPDLPKDARPVAVERAIVRGSGARARAAAAALADGGLPVTLLDDATESVDAAIAALRDSAPSDALIARLAGSTDKTDLAGAEFVVTALEDPEAERAAMAEAGRTCRQAAVIACGTARGDLEALAEASGRPESVVGVHLVAPAPGTGLAEIARTETTSTETAATALAIAKRIGATPVPVAPTLDYAARRLATAVGNTAATLEAAGNPRADIERAASDFGMALGPFALCEALGVTPEAAQDAAGGCGGEVGAEAIRARLLTALAEEGTRLVSEGTVASEAALDLIAIRGLGYPRHEGGPLFRAEREAAA